MIYAIGDSFTFGDELTDRNDAWPTVLSSMLDIPIINKGRPATGNLRMVKRAMDAVFDDAELIIIGWSDVNRIEFADDDGIYDLWAARNYRSFMDNFDHRSGIIKYMTAYDVPDYHYARWLRYIILIQNFCKLNEIPLVMFISCGANESHKLYSDNFKKLLDHVDQKQFVDGMSNSVAEWCYGLPYGVNGHPLTEGHQVIANKIYEYLGNIGWLP
jgi:hypothetical protein